MIAINMKMMFIGEVEHHTDDSHQHEDDVQHVAKLQHVVVVVLPAVSSFGALGV